MIAVRNCPDVRTKESCCIVACCGANWPSSATEKISKATRAETPPEWPFDLACSRPSQAEISSSILLIFSFRVWGHLKEGEKEGRAIAVLRLFLYNTSRRSHSPQDLPETLRPRRDPHLPGPSSADRDVRPTIRCILVCIPRVGANVFVFPEKEGSGCYRAAHHQSGAFSWSSHATRGGRDVVG